MYVKYVDNLTFYIPESTGEYVIMFIDTHEDNDEMYVFTKERNLICKENDEFVSLSSYMHPDVINKFKFTDTIKKYTNFLKSMDFNKNMKVFKIDNTKCDYDAIADIIEICEEFDKLKSKENIDDLVETNIILPKTCFKPKFQDKRNDNEMILYIILRNDINREFIDQCTDISILTKNIIENDKYSEYLGFNNNVVILEACGKELFEDNSIPTIYDNDFLIFAKHIEDQKRVAHANFVLTDAKTVGVAYLCEKKQAPKFINRLKLWQP